MRGLGRLQTIELSGPPITMEQILERSLLGGAFGFEYDNPYQKPVQTQREPRISHPLLVSTVVEVATDWSSMDLPTYCTLNHSTREFSWP